MSVENQFMLKKYLKKQIKRQIHRVYECILYTFYIKYYGGENMFSYSGFSQQRRFLNSLFELMPCYIICKYVSFIHIWFSPSFHGPHTKTQNIPYF